MAFKHYKQIKTQELPSMNVKNVPAFLKDFAISDDSANQLQAACSDCKLENRSSTPILTMR